jgi:hypothetical protein
MTRRAALAWPLEDAIVRAGAVPSDVARGLDLLERSPPLWPVDAATWAAVVASVSAFADRWDGQARDAGWSDLDLYGLHRFAPYANLSAMGAAFCAAADRRRLARVRARALCQSRSR